MDNGKTVLADPEVKQFLMDLVGDDGLDVIRVLMDREITDEDIAEETGLKLNTVRKILYKLYDYRLAGYIRTKDKKIGWYIYTWKLDLGRVFEILAARKRRVLEELTEKLEFERNHVFFSCKKDQAKIPFDIASENDFKCPHCNAIMEYVDNQGSIMRLEEEIAKLRKEIEH